MGDEPDSAQWFESQRPRLLRIATNLTGDFGESENVVQEAWLRLQRAEPGTINRPEAWLTTVVSRLSLDVLRSARHRREEPLQVQSWHEVADDGAGPEVHAIQADEVNGALLIVLETLSPAERLAFVLHDVFGLAFAEIAAILNRSEQAVRQLASRGRTRLRGTAPAVDNAPAARIVDAWLEAATNGRFEALLELLDEGAVLHADYGTHSDTIRGARSIAAQAVRSARLAAASTRVLVNHTPAVVAAPGGNIASIMTFDIREGLIVGLDVIADPGRLARVAGLTDLVRAAQHHTSGVQIRPVVESV